MPWLDALRARYPAGSQSRNTALIGAAELIRKGSIYVVLILCARFLGVEGFGLLSATLATGAILALAVDLGMNDLTVREVAQRPADAPREVANMLALKLGLLAVVVAGAFLLGRAEGGVERGVLVGVATLYYALLTFSQLAVAVFRGKGRMEYELGQRVAENGLLLVLALGAAVFTGEAGAVVLALGAAGVGSVLAASLLHRRAAGPVRMLAEGAQWRSILRRSFPFALSVGFFAIYYRVVILTTAARLGEREAGLFAACYQLVLGMLVLPAAAAAAAYPRLARLARDHDAYRRLLLRTTVPVAVAALALGAGIALAAPRLLDLVYGPEYAEATGVLRILMAALPMMFLTTVLAPSLQARNLAVVVSFVAACDVALGFLGAWYLAPRVGVEGAGYAVLLAETVSLALMGAVTVWDFRRSRGQAARSLTS